LKIFEAIKVFVDRGKSDIGDGVNFFEGEEDVITYSLGGDFISDHGSFCFQTRNHLIDGIFAYASFGRGQKDGSFEFCSIVEFFARIFFDDEQIAVFFSFIGIESVGAIFTYSPTFDGLSIFNDPGIDHFGIDIVA